MFYGYDLFWNDPETAQVYLLYSQLLRRPIDHPLPSPASVKSGLQKSRPRRVRRPVARGRREKKPFLKLRNDLPNQEWNANCPWSHF